MKGKEIAIVIGLSALTFVGLELLNAHVFPFRELLATGEMPSVGA